MRVEVAGTAQEFASVAADAVCALLRERSGAVLGLATGATPLGLYEELTRRYRDGLCDVRNATAFAVDELYGVPRGHPATNASYFARAGLPLRALHVMDSEAPDPDRECAAFLERIERAGGLDLAVLGIGTNGHIAFNEPGSPLDSRARLVELSETTRDVYAPRFGGRAAAPARGLTLGVADLLAARQVLLLANGPGKAGAVATALEGPVSEALPASALQRHPNVTVVLDRAAAARLRGS
jgi:glucosamine-6-phosphate deaminase